MDRDDCSHPEGAKEESADGEIDEKTDSETDAEHPDMADRRQEHGESNTNLFPDTHPVIVSLKFSARQRWQQD